MRHHFSLEIGHLAYRTLVMWQMFPALHSSILNFRDYLLTSL